MPCWSGLAMAARKMAPLASATAATTCVEVGAGCRRGGAPQEVDGERAGHLAGLVAAHAVGDGEDVGLGDEVVLVLGPDAAGVGGRAPAQVGHSLGLQHRVADLEAVARVQQAGAVEPVAVEVRAVGRAEVLDHRLAVDEVDAGVELGDEGVVRRS